jgi:hypothetical protein
MMIRYISLALLLVGMGLGLVLAQTPLPASVIQIPAPQGFERVAIADNSFGAFLRRLPLLTVPNAPIYYYNGQKVAFQEGHFAVIDKEIGTTDLQQCADVVMRLYAEYRYERKEYSLISFRLATGQTASFVEYAEGKRPVLEGNKWKFVPKAAPSYSEATFRQYLNFVYAYAGTMSLIHQLKPISDLSQIQIGDVFIQQGQPFGHAVIVVDIAQEPQTGRKKMMLLQGFLPAQSFHILKNPQNQSAWYDVPFAPTLQLPQWTFQPSDLRRFP